MKKLLLSLFLFIAVANAQQIDHVEYIHTVKDIHYQGDYVQIELNDGSIWHWDAREMGEHLLRKWEKGDEVWLRDGDKPGFLLYNPSKPRFTPLVKLVKGSIGHLLEIDELSMDGSFIALSDGSQWKILYDFQNAITRQWEIGDLIFPTKYGRDDYELINIDIPHDSRRANARYVNAELQFQLPKTKGPAYVPADDDEDFEDIFE